MNIYLLLFCGFLVVLQFISITFFSWSLLMWYGDILNVILGFLPLCVCVCVFTFIFYLCLSWGSYITTYMYRYICQVDVHSHFYVIMLYIFYFVYLLTNCRYKWFCFFSLLTFLLVLQVAESNILAFTSEIIFSPNFNLFVTLCFYLEKPLWHFF